MTACLYGIGRPGRSGPARFRAVVMIVVFLAASALFCAASAHHADGPVHVGHSMAEPGAVHADETAHEHQHGNGWTPQPIKRLRVATGVVAVAVTAVFAVLPGHTSVAARPAVASDTGLSLLGVLRI